MVSALYRLVYRSVVSIPGEEAEAARALAAILETSRRNNAAAGLTGALLHSGAQLVQVLEGPLAAVEAVFDRIATDLRHTSVELLQFSHIAQASFPAWSMAYVPQAGIEGLFDFETMRADGWAEAIEAALAVQPGLLDHARAMPAC